MTNTVSKDYQLEEPIIRTWSTFVPEEAGAAVAETLRSKWINTGKMEKLFREKVCAKFNVPNLVACTSGTAALRASLAVIGVGPGDEVVSTPYTFIATNTSILEQGGTPVFADIDYNTLNIDPESVRSKINAKTKAIICVHYGGNACNMDALRKIGKEYNLPIIEDSAHAMGAKYKGDFIGAKGDFVTFSFQVVKIITCGDGGAIATPNEEYYSKLKRAVWFGMDREEKKANRLDPLPEDISMLGFKYNMNDITATLGCVGIDNFDAPAKYRVEIGERYRKEFAKCKKLKLTHYPEENTPNYQIFPVHVENREKFADYMWDRGIQVNVNNRRNDRYTIFGGLRKDLSNLARAEDDVILIPLHADLTAKDVDRVVSAVLEYEKL